MERTLLLTFSNPSSADIEEEYHSWYTQVHIPQLLEHVPAIKVARRYRVVGEEMPHRFLVIYEIEGEVDEVLAGLAARRVDGSIQRSSNLQVDPPPLVVFAEPIDDCGRPLKAEERRVSEAERDGELAT